MRSFSGVIEPSTPITNLHVQRWACVGIIGREITVLAFLIQFALFTWFFYAMFNFGATDMTYQETLVAMSSSALIAGLLATCCTFGSVDFVAPKDLDDEIGGW